MNPPGIAADAVGSASPVLLVRLAYDARLHVGHPTHRFPALDLKYVQAALEARGGTAPALLDCWGDGQPDAQAARLIRECRPRVLAIKAASPCLRAAIELARSAAEWGALRVAVGQQAQHCAAAPDRDWLSAFDVALLGDPEMALPELIDRLDSGEERQGLVQEYRRRFERREAFVLDDPDSLPRPRFGPRELESYPFPFPLRRSELRRWGYVLSSWGCPYACRHCSLVMRKSTGSTLRQRSPALVIEDIAALARAGAQAISIEDDTLLYDAPHFGELCERLAASDRALPWIANARPPELTDAALERAAAAGALLFKVGVESGSARMIDGIGKGGAGEEWLRQSRRAFAALHRRGIGAVAMFVIGCPGETADDLRATLDLARELAPDYIQVQFFSPYPDVPLYAALADRGASAVASGQTHYSGACAGASAVPQQELLRWQLRIYRSFYLRPAYAARHLARFWRRYLNGRALVEGLRSLWWMLRPADQGSRSSRDGLNIQMFAGAQEQSRLDN